MGDDHHGHTLGGKGLHNLNRFGYLAKLSYYEDGYTFGKYGTVEGVLKAAEVITVQKNAEPLYWLSDTRKANAGTGIDYYVLVVNWKSGTTAKSVINKDTEMVYLSASLLTTNTGTTGGTGNAESSEPTA